MQSGPGNLQDIHVQHPRRSMVRPVLASDILAGVAAQFGVALHLRGCKQSGGQQMVFQVGVAQLGLADSDRRRRRTKAGRRRRPTREQRVKFGFLSN
jgi:hypothetical protein